MGTAETFVSELDAKNQASIQRIVDAQTAGITKENFEVGDVLRLVFKARMEAAEVAALWVSDCDSLEMKLSLAEQCGDGARQCRRLADRLAALGTFGYDPRDGGYSKVFAFMRSLGTAEERSAAGYVTAKALSVARLSALASFCNEKNDTETAQLLGEVIVEQERRYYEDGKKLLAEVATTEESQARGRRSAYRTLELATETVEPLQLRKVMAKRPPVPRP
jgi:hypothetical protein